MAKMTKNSSTTMLTLPMAARLSVRLLKMSCMPAERVSARSGLTARSTRSACGQSRRAAMRRQHIRRAAAALAQATSQQHVHTPAQPLRVHTLTMCRSRLSRASITRLDTTIRPSTWFWKKPR